MMSKVWLRTVRNYIEVLKPRESSLITFIGVCTALIAGSGQLPPARGALILITVLLGSCGANGLTNYLDRNLDARMLRTRSRVLPSKRISPPEKVLPLTIGLVLAGLVLAWILHPLVFISALVGLVAAVVWRKRWTCVFPQGILASCAPVLMGWLAVSPVFSWQLLLLCLLITVWLPLHLWSVMIANRDDYRGAGIGYFPISREPVEVVKILLALSIMLYATSIGLYYVGSFTWHYLLLANLLGVVVFYTSIRLNFSVSSQNSWQLYKLSSFPYLGLIFLAMCLDIKLFM